LAIAIVIAAASARADDQVDAPNPATCTHCALWKPPSPQRRAAAIALAVFPGIIVHGIGSWTVREDRAAKKLMYGELIAVGLASASGLLVFASGANQYTIVPGVPVLVAGTGIFLQSWFTDIWVAAGGHRIEQGPLALPPWSVEVGTIWLHEPYHERAVFSGAGQLWLGRIGLGAAGGIDASGDYKIGDADVRVRVLGAPATGKVIEDGSRLYVRMGGAVRDDDSDRTTQWLGEVEVNGRLDLDRIDEMFRSSFIELGAGLGFVRTSYGDDPSHDWSSVLLADFAWGTYLGSRGEAKLFYEHTRDSLAGGLPAWRAAGFVGSVGVAANVLVRGPWELRGELEIGNAWVTTLGVGFRGGSL
jgi:hypothetical protein